MEEKKSKKGLITIIILIILLLGAIGYLSYDMFYLDKNRKTQLEEVNSDYKKLQKEYNDVVKSNEENNKTNKELKEKVDSFKEKNYIVYNTGYGKNGDNINIYSISKWAGGIVYAKSGKMYMNTIDSLFHLDFDADDKPIKLGVNESDIEKVKSWEDVAEVYLILKDGKVLRAYNDNKNSYVFKDYKVKDIDLDCKPSGYSAVKCTIELTTQDGKTKTITEKDKDFRVSYHRY